MIYKITISEITESESEDTDYKKTGKDDEGNDVWEYVKNGKTKIQRDEKEIYTQEKTDLDVPELAVYINRAR